MIRISRLRAISASVIAGLLLGSATTLVATAPASAISWDGACPAAGTPLAWPGTWNAVRYLASPQDVIADTEHEYQDKAWDVSSGMNDYTVPYSSELRGPGTQASAYWASNATNSTPATTIFFRVRVIGDPALSTPGATSLLQSGMWQAEIGTGPAGSQTARVMVGVNGGGNNGHDFVYAAGMGSNTLNCLIYTTNSPSSGGWYRTSPITNGSVTQYFLDFQIPIAVLTHIDPAVTGTTIATLLYGTSAANNFTTFNKDEFQTPTGPADLNLVKPIDFSNPPQFSITTTAAGNGTVTPGTVSVDSGTVVTETATAGVGSHFASWSCTPTISPAINPLAPVLTFTLTSDEACTATFALDPVTLTYDSNTATGGAPPSAVTIGYGESTTIADSATMTKTVGSDNYAFVGWDTAPAGGGTFYAVGSSIVLFADITLYAQWVKIPSLAVNYQAGVTDPTVAGIPSDLHLYTAGETVTVKGPDPTRLGYSFTGWIPNPLTTCTNACMANDTFTIESSTVLTAQWSVNSYPLTFNANGGLVGGNATQTNLIPYNTDALSGAPTPIWSGYNFLGWSDSVTGVKLTSFLMPAHAATLYALWIPAVVTLTTNVTGSGSVTGGGLYGFGDTATVTAIPAAGYSFAGWGGACAGMLNPAIVTMTGALTCTANFSRNPVYYPLVETIVGSGTVAPPSGDYIEGSALTLVATPALGWSFVGWTGDCTGLTCAVTMNQQHRVTATFAQLFPLTTPVTGTGTVTRDLPGSNGYYPPGTVVTLTATPAAGQAFTGWSGDCAGSTNPLKVTVDKAKTCVANFSGLVPLVTASTGSGAVAVGPSAGPYVPGTLVTLTATPAAGWIFSNWTGSCSGTANPITITMDAAKSCTAQFQRVDPVPAGTYSPVNYGKSRINWEASPNATSYEITVQGKVVCTTAALTCQVSMLLGPNSKVYAIAINGSLRATPTRLTYKRGGPVLIFIVHFAEDSYVLRAGDKAMLRARAARIQVLGFKQVKVAGFTDSQGGTRNAIPLSTNRANAVIRYLRHYVKVGAAAKGYGNTHFVASNATERGRAANRRAEGFAF